MFEGAFLLRPPFHLRQKIVLLKILHLFFHLLRLLPVLPPPTLSLLRPPRRRSHLLRRLLLRPNLWIIELKSQ